MTALAIWLAGRSGRERALLALLVVLALPLAGWLAVAQPLLAARDRARADLAAAQDQAAWVAARLAEAAALPAPAPGPAPVGLAGLEQRLSAAGLGGGARLGDAEGGAVALGFDQVDFIALMDWLDAVQAQAGYRVAALRLVPADAPGTVAAQIRLEPAP